MATRFADDPAKLPFGVSVLTADQMRDAGVSTVNEALMKLLGVPGRLDLYGGGEYALDLRGFGSVADSNQVVIVDGIRLTEADLGGTRLAGIPIDSVERIEVLRGNAAVLYGEGATGGAIVITTKAASGKAQGSSARVHMAMGSQSLLDTRVGGTLASGGFSVDVAGNKRSSDGHRDNFRSDADGASAAVQWHNEWMRVGARRTRDSLDTGLPGDLTADEYALNPRQSTHPLDHASIRNERSSLFAQATLGDWELGLDGGARDKSLESLSGGVYAYEVEARNQSLRARNRSSFGAVQNALVVGVDHAAWERTVLSPSVARSNQTTRAVYLKDDVGLTSGTHLSVGLRRQTLRNDNTDAPGAAVDERLNAWDVGVVQAVGSGAAVYARVGRSFRLANVDEIGFVGSALRPQTSRDVELGARWGDSATRAEMRLYRSALTDEIGYDPDAIGPYSAFGFDGANVNFAATRRQGLELELAHELSSALQLRLNAAARQARFTSGVHDGKSMALTPRRTLSVGADWKPASGHKLTANLNAVSSQSPDFDNACTMPGYSTTDVRYAYQALSVELALGIANLTDKKFYTLAFRCQAGETTSIYPEAGRSFVASARVSF